MNWTEDYRVLSGDASLVLMHMPRQTVLLQTQSVSMETLNGLMNEFDTHGEIRDNWRSEAG